MVGGVTEETLPTRLRSKVVPSEGVKEVRNTFSTEEVLL